MLSVGQAEAIPGALRVPVRDREGSGKAPVRSLARHERLFHAGEIKTHLYRVESGVLCIYATRADLTLELIEFAVAGDIVGMGFAKTHATTARAVVETKVSCFPLDASDRLLTRDERATSRMADAVEREFAFQRHNLVEAGQGKPATRLAAFLVAVSRRNALEGGDPNLIDDTLNCAVIAEHLGLRLDILALTLVQLEIQGLVRPALDHGLRLIDVAGLEALADVYDGTRVPSDPYDEAPLPTATSGSPDLGVDGLAAKGAADDEGPLQGKLRSAPLCYARQDLVERLDSADADPHGGALMVCITAVTFATVFALAYGGWAL
jgi:CRP/FNR family transcriptional regulator, anaerobic regulatory protein